MLQQINTQKEFLYMFSKLKDCDTQNLLSFPIDNNVYFPYNMYIIRKNCILPKGLK